MTIKYIIAGTFEAGQARAREMGLSNHPRIITQLEQLMAVEIHEGEYEIVHISALEEGFLETLKTRIR